MLKMVGLEGLKKEMLHFFPVDSSSELPLPELLSNEPKVLLLDEPLGALDAKIRKQMQIELKKIQREVGITFYLCHP